MRLWHKDLIKVLPRQQLLAQWRECCCIARNIAVNGSPNHILVNPIMDHTISDFIHYTMLVYREMVDRHIKCQWDRFIQHFPLYCFNGYWIYNDLYNDWHNERYLTQCYYNLQEKFDRGGIPADEWERIENFYNSRGYNYGKDNGGAITRNCKL